MSFDLEYLRNRDAGKINRFCPLMGEDCTRGWTKKMGKTKGVPNLGACAAWQPVFFHHKKENQTEKLYGCAAYDHPNVLLADVANQTAYVGPALDKVANEVNDQHATLIGLSSDDAKRRLATSRPMMTIKKGRVSDALRLERAPGATDGV